MRLLATLIFSVLVLFADNKTNYLKAQILEKVFSNISINNELIVWSNNSELLSEFKKNAHLDTAVNCENATLLIVENKDKLNDICKEKTMFVLNYNLLNDFPKSFGALFWKKGRPNIVIIEPRTKAQSIKISKNLEEYLEEAIW
jgi:hypothetical protein